MFLTDISVGEAAITAILGYAVVFFGLILLMIVMILLGKTFTALDNQNVSKKMPAAAPATPAEVPATTAPGSAGGVKLYNVEPKTAAMLMAIVADKMGKPLNELRFISIKEVE